MRARTRKLVSALGETSWLLPGLMVPAGVLGAVGLVLLDRSGAAPHWLIDSPWLHNGGGTGARILLGAVASSTIGVAGTVFFVTIASLSLAGSLPRHLLLRADGAALHPHAARGRITSGLMPGVDTGRCPRRNRQEPARR